MPEKGPAAVAAHPAVGVHNDLAAGQARIGVGPAQQKTARGIDEEPGFLGQQAGGLQHLLGLGDKVLADPAGRGLVGLMADDHRADAPGFAVPVADRDLGLGVRAQVGDGLGAADLLQVLEDVVAQGNGRGHQFRRLIAGVAEHHALVAGALTLEPALAHGHPLGDIRRLAVQPGKILEAPVPELQLRPVVADLLHHGPGDLFGVDAVPSRAGDLARVDQHVVGGHGFAGHPAGLVQGQAGVQHRVRDLVAKFVGMTRADRFGGENMLAADFTHDPMCISFFWVKGFAQ